MRPIPARCPTCAPAVRRDRLAGIRRASPRCSTGATSSSPSASSCCRPSSPNATDAVKREEIDAFKRQFRIPPEGVRDIGRLFDQARDSADGFEAYAAQLGEAFADNRGMLEDVLAALFVIARADGPVNGARTRVPVAHASRVWPRSGCLGPRTRRDAAPAGMPTNRTHTWCSACLARQRSRKSARPGSG